jgi:hypothetical protein
VPNSCDCSPQPLLGEDGSASGVAPCPTNGQIGKPVDSITLKALLALPLSLLQPTEYRLCLSPDCPTVYYSVDGAHLVREAELRELVFQKHQHNDDALVCYCFRYTVGNIRHAVEQSDTSAVLAHISIGVRAGQCACDIRNPQGTCCLGNVRQIIKRLSHENAHMPMNEDVQP